MIESYKKLQITRSFCISGVRSVGFRGSTRTCTLRELSSMAFYAPDTVKSCVRTTYLERREGSSINALFNGVFPISCVPSYPANTHHSAAYLKAERLSGQRNSSEYRNYPSRQLSDYLISIYCLKMFDFHRFKCQRYFFTAGTKAHCSLNRC